MSLNWWANSYPGAESGGEAYIAGEDETEEKIPSPIWEKGIPTQPAPCFTIDEVDTEV
jgi:hypothetical protein